MKPIVELTIKLPKGMIHKSTCTPQAIVAQNYNIVEDLTGTPLTMSALEVLQNFPSRKNYLLAVIRGLDPLANLVVFNHENHTPKFPPHLDFMIQVVIISKTINRAIVGEGA